MNERGTTEPAGGRRVVFLLGPVGDAGAASTGALLQEFHATAFGGLADSQKEAKAAKIGSKGGTE